MLGRKIPLAIVIAVVLSLLMASTAFATYYGWWNNSLTFESGTYTYKGNYCLESTIGGFLGNFNSDHGAGSTFWCTLQYYSGRWTSYGAHGGLNSNGYVERKWQPINAYLSHRYRFTADKVDGEDQTVTCNNAGYFWEE